jgi:hypothetical protein
MEVTAGKLGRERGPVVGLADALQIGRERYATALGGAREYS